MIEIRNLVKKYSGKTILGGINLDIKDGEIFSLLGPSGTGKSTFLKSIIGLVKPDGGSIKIDGADITKTFGEFEIQKIRKNFGYLFQEGALFDSLNVWENVAFGLRYLTDIKESEYLKTAGEKLELVGLKNSENLKISELSGGMKKRVALARAIAANPKYLLYDEPTTGLDPVTAETVSELIKEMSKKLKVTSISVTHDVKLALEISDRIALLNEGGFACLGTPEEIKNSKNGIVKEFIENSICRK
ncbi:MAG: ABC transporter ATP-binding protein [Elusimicrobia bacterium CG08_land_8_20_14_0_20_51_18]|nr:MAG: ABC transporter ATP-binding protein [Elusimicrobia bacterium CG08_land_8_20_14_0_20_51_18]